MKPINNIVVVEPLNLKKENDPLSGFVMPGQNKGWNPTNSVEVMRVVSVGEKESLEGWINKLAILEATQVKSVTHSGKTYYFVDPRYIYGFVDGE